MLLERLPLLLAAGGAILYVSSRAAADALGGESGRSAERTALGHWISISFAALFATAVGRHEIGIAITFGTSVALLSLCLGVLALLATTPISTPTRSRAWPLLAPAAILPMMAGFRGSLNWMHAAMLLILGVLIARAWFSPDARTHAQSAAAPRAAGLLLALAIALAGIGAWLTYLAVIASTESAPAVSTGLIATVVVSPLLVLPVLGTGSAAAHEARLPDFLNVLVALLLLNLCLLLPAVIATSYAREAYLALHSGAKKWEEVRAVLHAVPFPLAVWRIDAVLLIVLALMLVPVSLGRWALWRAEGIALLIVYVAYLVMSMVLGIRA